MRTSPAPIVASHTTLTTNQGGPEMAWLRAEVRAKVTRGDQVAAIAEATPALNPVGSPPGNPNVAKSEVTDEEPENNSTVSRIEPLGKKGPDTSARLTARIARDNPEVLARMKAGEFRSVRQAAISAGIVKPTATVPLDPEARTVLRGLPSRPVVAATATTAG